MRDVLAHERDRAVFVAVCERVDDLLVLGDRFAQRALIRFDRRLAQQAELQHELAVGRDEMLIADAFDHRAPQGEMAERYGPRHAVELAADSEIARLVGSRRIEVNSLHWQAIDRLADRLIVEGRAPDGVIEAVRVADARSFALGVQWHPEWRVQQNPVSMALFRAFGDAARRRAEQRTRGLAAA